MIYRMLVACMYMSFLFCCHGTCLSERASIHQVLFICSNYLVGRYVNIKTPLDVSIALITRSKQTILFETLNGLQSGYLHKMLNIDFLSAR